MAYGDFKDLNRRTAADKVLHDKALNIAKNLKCGEYQRGIASLAYKFFDKKNSGGAIKNENILWYYAANLYKAIIRKFEKKSTLIFDRQYFVCWSKFLRLECYW